MTLRASLLVLVLVLAGLPFVASGATLGTAEPGPTASVATTPIRAAAPGARFGAAEPGPDGAVAAASGNAAPAVFLAAAAEVDPAVATPAAPAAPAGTGERIARPNADDPVLEKRLIGLTKELRCMVCQNESIADSHAPLAVDMRNEIRAQLRDGMSDREVIDFMVARYGNFVRFRPPLDLMTIALWFGPALLMLAGLFALVRQLRQRNAAATAGAQEKLSATDRARLASLARPTNDE